MLFWGSSVFTFVLTHCSEAFINFEQTLAHIFPLPCEPGAVTLLGEMEIKSYVFKLWKEHFTILTMLLYSLILVAYEKTLESDFQCVGSQWLRLAHSLSYFIVPALILLFLGIISQPECVICNYECSMIAKALLPPFLWIAILLLDGRYTACLCSPWENSTFQSTYGLREIEKFSQLAGLALVLVMALVGFLCWCRKCCRERVTMNTSQSLRRLRKQATDYLDKQQNEAIQKLIEKHLHDHYLATPETFVTGLRDEVVSSEIRQVLNVPWEQQRAAGGAQSTPSSPSPQGTSAFATRGLQSSTSRETQNLELSQGARTPQDVWPPVTAPAISLQTRFTRAQPPTKGTKKPCGKDRRTHPYFNLQESSPLLTSVDFPSSPRPGGL